MTALGGDTAVAQELTFFLRGREVFCKLAVQGTRRGALAVGLFPLRSAGAL